jgi:hypothetical protein
MFYDNGTFKSASDLLGFGESYNPTYVGTEDVRGIVCNVWAVSTITISDVDQKNFTSYYHFSAPEWNYNQPGAEVLLRIRVLGVSISLVDGSSTLLLDHSYNYFNFKKDVDDSTWEIPTFCPVEDLEPIPFPTLPTRFRTASSIMFPLWNTSISTQQYYDQVGNRFRVDFNSNNKRLHQIWDISKVCEKSIY